MSPRRTLAGLALVAATAAAGHAVGSTRAAFSSSTQNPSTMQAKQVFPGTRSWSAWDLRDASSGAEANVSDAEAFTGRTQNTKNWTATWSPARYLQYDLNDPLPAGLTTTGATFGFDFADARNNAADQICFYFEVRRRSTNVVIGTHGSTASPVACAATTTIVTTSTALPEVTSTDIANDLRIRLYAMHTAARAMIVDRAVVSASTPVAGFTLYETTAVDAANGVPTTTRWAISALDGNGYTSTNNWQTAFSAARYLKATFPTYLPATATISSAQLVHAYRPSGGGTACYYAEVYSGVTLLGTHGSAAAPFCNAAVAYATDTIALPELNTAALVNGVIVKLYVRNSAGRRSQHDLLKLDVGYAVD